MAVLFIILGVVSTVCFLRGKYVPFLFFSLLLVYNGFGILGEESSNIGTDLMIVSTLIILFFQSVNDKNVFNVRNDKVGKIILFLLIYEAIRSFSSPFLGEETFSYAIKVYRKDLIFLFYFLFRQIPFSDYTKFLKLSLPIFTVSGVFFIDSVYTHFLTKTEFYFRASMMGIALPIITSLLWDVKTIKWRIFIVIFWMFIIIATEARGYFIATITSISFYYIFVKRKLKLVFPLVIFVFVAYTALKYMDTNKQSGTAGSNSLTEELAAARNIDSYKDSSRGSFALRVALTFERADYLFSHPQNLLFGVGAIHEDSPNNRFWFIVGSRKTDSDENKIMQMIDTEDVAFVSHWFRYGSIYLVLMFAFIISVIRRCIKYRDIRLMAATLVSVVAVVISSLSCDFFSNCHRFYMIMMLVGISYNCLISYRKALSRS